MFERRLDPHITMNGRKGMGKGRANAMMYS